MAAAGGVVVAQQWADMSYAARVGVLGVTALVLVRGRSSGVVLFRGSRSWDDLRNGDTLRRLAGTLFTFGAGATFSTVMVAMLSEQAAVSEFEAGRATVIAAAAAFASSWRSRLLADSALSELALFGAMVGMVAGVLAMTTEDSEYSARAMQWTLLAAGLAWALVATYTRILRNQTLGTALGLALALFGAATVSENPWSHRVALLVMVAVTLAVYLTRPSWPYITAAIVAAVILTVTWVGETVGAALALLSAGVVVLRARRWGALPAPAPQRTRAMKEVAAIVASQARRRQAGRSYALTRSPPGSYQGRSDAVAGMRSQATSTS